MDVRVRNQLEGAVVIEVQGEVDLYTSPRVREAIVRAMTARSPTVVVDLAGVGYMDSSGVATLLEGLKLARGYGGAFRLAAPGDTVRQVFKFARLDKVFEIYSDAQGALAEPRG